MQLNELLKPIAAMLCLLHLWSCNKNADQLPLTQIKPTRITIPGRLDNLGMIDFIFEQNRLAGSDTVWLSLKNTTQQDIESLSYLVELCRAAPQNFDSCDLQTTGTLNQPLKAGETIHKVYTWQSKNIKLDASLINVGILGIKGRNNHPLSGAYGSYYAAFERDLTAATPAYFGRAIGYIFADGTARFRLKGQGNANYNAEGQFTQLNINNGLLLDPQNIFAPFQLDPLMVNGQSQTVDSSISNQLRFRIRLQKPLNDEINTILVVTQK